MPYKNYILTSLKKSKIKKKKLTAVFKNIKTNRTKTIHFGASGYSDYTIHKDYKRKLRYIARHVRSENWDDPMTAGSLAYYILWNKPSLQSSIKDYIKKFKLK